MHNTKVSNKLFFLVHPINVCLKKMFSWKLNNENKFTYLNYTKLNVVL